MTRTPDEIYHGYRIFVFVLPLGDDQWSATSEVESHDADGTETFQQFGGPCYGRTSDEAKTLVLADSRQKIDDILAEPC